MRFTKLHDNLILICTTAIIQAILLELSLYFCYNEIIYESDMAVIKNEKRFQAKHRLFYSGFSGKKIIVGGKAFPAGYFFMNALNEYWKEAPESADSNPKGDWLIGSRLLSTHLHMWNVRDDIVAGHLDENAAAKLHESIQYILRVLRRARPFRYLDLEAEIHCYIRGSSIFLHVYSVAKQSGKTRAT